MPWLPAAIRVRRRPIFQCRARAGHLGCGRARAAGVAIAVAARHRAVGFALALAFASIAAGFAVATLKTAAISHPILHFPAVADVRGFVEIREEREKTDRIVIRVHHIDGRRLNEAPTGCGLRCAKAPRRRSGSLCG